MILRELIAALVAAGDQLPLGMDAEARVHLCRGHGRFGIITTVVTVDITGRAALVQGHPHLDGGPTVWRPLTLDADEEFAQLVDDEGSVHGGVPQSAIIQIEGGPTYRMPLRSTGRALAPGELEALRVGCLCDPARNELARELASSSEHVAVVIHRECPVHQLIDGSGS